MSDKVLSKHVLHTVIRGACRAWQEELTNEYKKQCSRIIDSHEALRKRAEDAEGERLEEIQKKVDAWREMAERKNDILDLEATISRQSDEHASNYAAQEAKYEAERDALKGALLASVKFIETMIADLDNLKPQEGGKG